MSYIYTDNTVAYCICFQFKKLRVRLHCVTIATMRRLNDEELPLPMCLSWTEEGVEGLAKNKFVLQENDTGEILVFRSYELSYPIPIPSYLYPICDLSYPIPFDTTQCYTILFNPIRFYSILLDPVLCPAIGYNPCIVVYLYMTSVALSHYKHKEFFDCA